MKNGVVMYDKVYQILKNKIECRLLPNGTVLPSRADLCKEYATSEKTVRRALELLAEEGLIRSTQRKRPVVTFDPAAAQKKDLLSLKKADAIAAGDILKTGVFLCYPLINHGLSLCSGADWSIPEAIFDKMDPNQPAGFWRRSSQFWRFFIARSENGLVLRVIDSLGLADLDPEPGTYEIRLAYYLKLKEFIQTVKRGGDPESVQFADLSFLYGFLPDRKICAPAYRVAPDSPFCMGIHGLEAWICKEEEQYTRVYLDILALISIGRYQPGDRLPAHAELCGIYGVSVDTTIKAIQILQEWGVVTATRGKGIFVAMDLTGLQKIHIPLDLIARHVRRFLDSLELLSLTVGGVAAHAGANVTAEEANILYGRLERDWNEKYLYQLSPIVLLEFIVEHIQYGALRNIYSAVQSNYHIGRSIPQFVSAAKTPGNYEIQRQCLDAAKALIRGDPGLFAKKTAGMFQYTHRMVTVKCKQLGYWKAAMQVYDGSVLWK